MNDVDTHPVSMPGASGPDNTGAGNTISGHTEPGAPTNYAQARRRFLFAARQAGVEPETLSWCTGTGEILHIDIAWLGAYPARRVVLHSSGLHGVEGFAGSDIQCTLLHTPPPLRSDEALILVHVLNPWGMARLRRANEHNVDLNRNCLPAGQTYTGCPIAYRRLDPLLNPPTPPARDAFYVRALWALLRHGPARVRQAVAGGQYSYPRGLFYGGQTLEPGLVVYRDWLCRKLVGVAQVDAIDVHTGLGRWGQVSVFVETEEGVEAWREAGYASRGGLMACLQDWLPGRAVYGVVQEFGTYSSLRVVHALREENRRYHHGVYGGACSDNDGINELTREGVRLRDRLYPDSRVWRERVIQQGIALVQRWCVSGAD